MLKVNKPHTSSELPKKWLALHSSRRPTTQALPGAQGKPLQERQSSKQTNKQKATWRKQRPWREQIISKESNFLFRRLRECHTWKQNRMHKKKKKTQLFIDEKRKFKTITEMKTQQTGWKLKKSSPQKAKDKEIENRRKSEDWSRKYNTHIIGVLERKTCYQKQIRQLERTRWLLSTIDENRLPHRKVIVNFRIPGKGKDSTRSQGKEKKGQVQSIKNQNGFPLSAATLGGSIQQSNAVTLLKVI